MWTGRRYVVEVSILLESDPMSKHEADSGPTGDYSTWSVASIAVLIAGFAGGIMLIWADLSTLVEIHVVTVVQQELSGRDQHNWAVALLGVAALPLAWGAARRRARPAMLGLGLIGLVVALIALVGDLPDLNETGVVGERYEEAAAQAGAGFYLETAGAALLMLAGGGGLLLLTPREDRSGRDRRPRPDEVGDEPA